MIKKLILVSLVKRLAQQSSKIPPKYFARARVRIRAQEKKEHNVGMKKLQQHKTVQS